MDMKRCKSSGVLYATKLMAASAPICIPLALRLTLANIIVSDVPQAAAGSFLSKLSQASHPPPIQSQDNQAMTQGPLSSTLELKKAPKCFNKLMKFSFHQSPLIMNRVTTISKTWSMIFIHTPPSI